VDVATAEEELRQAGQENRRLRRMLEDLTRSYSTLYHQLIQAQQHQVNQTYYPFQISLIQTSTYSLLLIDPVVVSGSVFSVPSSKKRK
jgi:hypothetical protein